MRKEYTGNAPQTTLTSSMSAGSPTDGATFTVASGTGYPTGATGVFTLKLDAGTPNEEKILCLSRSGNTFTLATSSRGYDSTTAQSHGGGITAGTVDHCIDSVAMTDMQGHIYDTTRDDHTQYVKKALYTAKGQVMGASASATPGVLAVGTDGQVFTADAASTLGWKWASILPTVSVVATQEARSNTAYGALTTAQSISVTVTATGVLLITLGAEIINDTAGEWSYVSVALSGANTVAASDAKSIHLRATAINSPVVDFGKTLVFTGLSTGATTITLQVRSTAASTATISNRHLSGIPG